MPPADEGLVMGDLAPYGLESGRAPTVPGPSGGSLRPKASGEATAARLARLRARFRNCYNKALSSDPELTGRIVFRIEVNPDGTIKSASVDETQTSESMLRNTELSGCLLRAIQTTDLGPTGKSAPITFSLPLEIRPSAPLGRVDQ